MDGTEFEYGKTLAAGMLRDGLKRASDQGISQRSLAKALGYKQSVVLSHMALGRVPIPVDRARQLATHIGLNQREFLLAVLKQRFPDISWSDTLGASQVREATTDLVGTLELIAGRPLMELSEEQAKVMREVAADTNAGRRWLSVHEVATVEMIRKAVPTFSNSGLQMSDLDAIAALLTL